MSLLTFHKPEKVLLQKVNEFEGFFEFKPLEPGFGVTIGNSLRRILLSSLEGYAITAIKIEGVDHEFATIKGVIQDVVDIILNLKQIRLKNISGSEVSEEKIFLSIKDKTEFKAGDIDKFTNNFSAVNQDLVLCEMEKWVKLDIELTVQRGRGYVPAEENKPKDAPLGTLPIDAIFTPIKNVKYHIENTRVEQRTDYEKLVLELKTDGTIDPEEAIKESARVMIQHLMLVSDDNISFDTQEDGEEDIVDEHMLHMRKLLKTSLEDLDLSVRAYNCLKAAKINSLSELVQYDTSELLKFRNFGKKSLVEIEAVLNEKGLKFGMDLSKYKFTEE